ncbi:MAG: ATP-grasp domain-containing protein [Acidobacteria bacterium]|nr:ATP-grasp domain-containing protein [Acidobacteriota bacterium]
MSIHRLLIANRGEIAVRIARACRELDIESVAVCSTIDADALHARVADRCITIGPPRPRDSYLSIGAIIDAARRAGADAVHPGYGFLSENAEMAAACTDAGLIWVGPPADVIARLGSKIAARRLMESAGVPVVPGATPRDQSDAGLADAAQRVGFPLLVKASAGGGGRGMRAVSQAHELAEAVGAARREATAAFGDGTLYVERLLTRPRHIEVQIIADHEGQVIHLYERECSIQRRHQKVIEESPAPHLAPALRARLLQAAVTAAETSGYRNAGTVEFLVEHHDQDDAVVAFLEMNTRLQVEHPITEAVTGRDLVHAQLALAAGAPLPWTQEEIQVRGHAIECRLYAEDPEDDFTPHAGRLLRFDAPTGPGIRVDAGVVTGSLVSAHYDALLAKIVAQADTRETALARARAALTRLVVLGVQTNAALLSRILAHPCMVAGQVDTGFLESERDALLTGPATDEAGEPAQALAAALALHERLQAGSGPGLGRGMDRDAPDRRNPWDTLGGWRLV